MSSLAPSAVPLTSAAVNLTVNLSSRAESRAFFNAVYHASDAIPMASTAKVANCVAGTNSLAFQDAVLRRINWYRAMAGVPANVTFDPSFSRDAQLAALMMSAKGDLSHTPTSAWRCWTAAGSNAAYQANLVLASTGADSITAYMDDYGMGNETVGHRRWLLYPQTLSMGTGDVPSQGTNLAANATWVIDNHFADPRPPTRRPEVTWPPSGYVPYPVVFRRWSFSYPGANFSGATVAMSSNGIPITATKEQVANGYGDNTLVWVPAGIEPNSPLYHWPRPIADTVYSVTLSNVFIQGNPNTFTYAVIVFDPDVAGADETFTSLSGSAMPTPGQTNLYAINPVRYATRYEWRASRAVPFSFTDKAENGATNFVVAISPGYSVVLSGVGVSGTKALHLVQPQPTVPQTLTYKTTFAPSTNSLLSFKSRLGTSGDGQYARVQVSTDVGVSWTDLYTQRGYGGTGETTFATRTLPLTNYAGHSLQFRFAYDFTGGGYFAQTNAAYGWLLDDIVLTNVIALTAPTSGMANGTSFGFVPAVATNYFIEARGVMFDSFGLSWGPLFSSQALTLPQLFRPVRTGSVCRIEFTPGTFAPSSLRLSKASLLAGPWSIDPTAVLDTNTVTHRPRFTTAGSTNVQNYFRVVAP